MLERWQAGSFALIGCVAAVMVSTGTSAVAIAGSLLAGRALPDDPMELFSWPPVLIASIAGTSGTLLLVALVTPWLVRVPIRDALGLGGAPALAVVAGPIGTIGIGPVGDFLMVEAAELAPDLTLGNLDLLSSFIESTPPWAAWPLLALMPGVCEELFFRGMLQRGLGRGPVAVLVAGVAFAAFHMDPHHVVGVLPVGLYLGFLGARTGSTLVPILCHVLNNTLALVQAHVPYMHVGYGTGVPIPWWLPVGGLAVAALAAVAVWVCTRPAADQGELDRST